MKRSLMRALAWGGLVAVTAAGCELFSQVQARTLAVSTLLTVPRVELRPQALAGFSGFDGGSFDPGALLDGGLAIPPQTLVEVFFGQREGAELTSTSIVPLAGASVTLTQVGGPSVQLVERTGGNHGLGPDAGFVYVDGATYRFTYLHAGSTYTAEVKQVPGQETISRFTDAPGYIEIAAGTPVSFTRPDPPQGQQRPLGFVSVIPVSPSGAQGFTPTYTNIPMAPLDFLELVVAPNDWLTNPVTVPGSAFPERDRNYLIVLQSAKLGGPTSDNLFTGSAILAGTAAVGVVKTLP